MPSVKNCAGGSTTNPHPCWTNSSSSSNNCKNGNKMVVVCLLLLFFLLLGGTAVAHLAPNNNRNDDENNTMTSFIRKELQNPIVQLSWAEGGGVRLAAWVRRWWENETRTRKDIFFWRVCSSFFICLLLLWAPGRTILTSKCHCNIFPGRSASLPLDWLFFSTPGLNYAQV